MELVNLLITFLIRLLEVMFVVGAVGCICSVIPITAYRLFMVLFETEDPGNEPGPAQAQTKSQPSTFTSASPEPGN